MIRSKILTIPFHRRTHLLKQLVSIASLALGDGLTLILAFWLAVLARDEVVNRLFSNTSGQGFPLVHYLDFWWMAVVWFLLLSFEGFYTRRRTFWDETQALWKVITLASLSIFAIVALAKLSPSISRTTLVLNWLFLLPLMPLSRLGAKKLLFRLGPWRRDVLILGAAETGKLALKALNQEPLSGSWVVGFLDDDPVKQGVVVGRYRGEPIRVIGRLSQAIDFLEQGLARDVIIAIPGMAEEKLISLIQRLQGSARTIRIIPNLWGLSAISTEVEHFMYNRLFMITLSRAPLESWSRALKRGFDILVASGFLLLTFPLLALIATAIKLTSRGPIFYRWRVIGHNGRPFTSYKFRTMLVDADERKKELLSQNEMNGPVFKLQNDPRVTRVGQILRKFSVDEFPQLWSVLKGDMSLVGPRPVLVYEYEQFEKWQKRKLTVKPGMISLWHISGKPHNFNEWVRLDLEYIDRWSLWLDLKILLLGIPYLLLGKGESVTKADSSEEL